MTRTRAAFIAMLACMASSLAIAAAPAAARDGTIGIGYPGDPASMNSCPWSSVQCTFVAYGAGAGTAPANGTLTSFQVAHRTVVAGSLTFRLLALDSDGGGGLTVRQISAAQTIAAGDANAPAGTTSFALSSPLPIAAGQLIGVSVQSSGGAPIPKLVTDASETTTFTCSNAPIVGQAPSGCDIGVYGSGVALTAYFYSDIRPPVVTADTGTANGYSGADLRAKVNPNGSPTTAFFRYGTSSGALSTTTATQALGNGSTAVALSQSIGGLSPSTTYYYRAYATNETDTTVGPLQQVTTGPPPPAPTVTGADPADVSETGARLAGSIVPHGDATSWRFVYGPSTAYGSATATQVVGSASGESAVAVSAALGGLEPDTTYHWRLVATNAGGTSQTADGTFRTARGRAPALAGFELQDVTGTTAKLHFTLDPEGYSSTFYVEFGTTTAYGGRGPTSDASAATRGPQGAFQRLESLGPGTTYHWRVVATNRWGTTVGPDQTFTTRTLPAVSEDPAAHEVTATSALLVGAVDPRGLPTSERFEYGRTSAYGSASASAEVGSGQGPVGVRFRADDLAPGTLYHWRIVATSAGGTTAGEDHVLVTLPDTPAPPLFTVALRPFTVYVQTIVRPERAVLVAGTSFGRSLTRATRDGRATPAEQRTLLRQSAGYLTRLQRAISALRKARPTADLRRDHSGEIRRLQGLQGALQQLRTAFRLHSATRYRNAYRSYVKAAARKSSLTRGIDRRSVDASGRGVFGKNARVDYASAKAKALIGTWHGATDSGTLVLTGDGKYTSPNGGGGTWRPTSDGVAFTGTMTYNGGHAIVKDGVMEFYWKHEDGAINYFVYTKS